MKKKPLPRKKMPPPKKRSKKQAHIKNKECDTAMNIDSLAKDEDPRRIRIKKRPPKRILISSIPKDDQVRLQIEDDASGKMRFFTIPKSYAADSNLGVFHRDFLRIEKETGVELKAEGYSFWYLQKYRDYLETGLEASGREVPRTESGDLDVDRAERFIEMFLEKSLISFAEWMKLEQSREEGVAEYGFVEFPDEINVQPKPPKQPAMIFTIFEETRTFRKQEIEKLQVWKPKKLEVLQTSCQPIIDVLEKEKKDAGRGLCFTDILARLSKTGDGRQTRRYISIMRKLSIIDYNNKHGFYIVGHPPKNPRKHTRRT